MYTNRRRGDTRKLVRYGGPLLLALTLLPGGGCLTPSKTTPTPEGAEVTAKRAELPPDAGARVCLTLAGSLEREGHEKEAAGQYERARQLDPHVQVSRQLAVLYDKVGEPKLALKEYQAALESAPRDADLLNNFGYFYYNNGKLPEAEEKLRAALALNPKHQRAWNNLGLVLGQKECYPESLEAFEKVVTKAEAHSNLAFIMATQGKVVEAKGQYQQALRLEPNLVRARLALDKLDHPGKTAPPALTPMEAARKAAQERLQARMPPSQNQQAAVRVSTPPETESVIVTPTMARHEE